MGPMLGTSGTRNSWQGQAWASQGGQAPPQGMQPQGAGGRGEAKGLKMLRSWREGKEEQEEPGGGWQHFFPGWNSLAQPVLRYVLLTPFWQMAAACSLSSFLPAGRGHRRFPSPALSPLLSAADGGRGLHSPGTQTRGLSPHLGRGSGWLPHGVNYSQYALRQEHQLGHRLFSRRGASGAW